MLKYQEATSIIPIKEYSMHYDKNFQKYCSSSTGSLCTNDHTKIINLLMQNETIPEHLTFPTISAELKKKYKPRIMQGFALFFTGLSGAGKSTLAKILSVKLLELNSRPVTLLDGDIVRKNLSSELSFSKEHRNLNVTRIGFVASEIVKNGGIAICAPIAPYPESRRAIRKQITQYGGFIEIYVSTPLATCEQRDCKGLYAKAHAGLIKGMTGIDDPYIEPEHPELNIDTSKRTPNEATFEIINYLRMNGYIK